MTAYDSDAALDALLAGADDAVLAAVEGGLDRTAGQRALHTRAQYTRAQPSTLLADAAAVYMVAHQRSADAAHCENALLAELLDVLAEAGRATRMLRCRLEEPQHLAHLEAAIGLLRILAGAARQRAMDGPTTLRALDMVRRHVGCVKDGIADMEGIDEADLAGLPEHFALLEDLLVQAKALAVRLFADDGEMSLLPVPVR
ncbi:hypothetical protein AB0I66_41655 [Streptomyces sp. NPDC050439]|uniref:hypothetical protein n=1 Tax=unclassified Streptomyces TaxID=2593676 RepID=UPI00342BDF45